MGDRLMDIDDDAKLIADSEDHWDQQKQPWPILSMASLFIYRCTEPHHSDNWDNWFRDFTYGIHWKD